MPECPRCGTLASDKAERCPSCGLRFVEEASAANTPGFVDISGAVALHIVEYAGFWRRFGAFAVDVFILSAIEQGFVVFLWRTFSPATDINSLSPGLILLIGLFEFLLTWLYYAFMESSKWQGTLGKQISGIIITDNEGRRISFGRATGRYFAKTLSVLMLGIGYLMIIFSRKKQGLHDMMAGCLVVKKKVYKVAPPVVVVGLPVQGTLEMIALPVVGETKEQPPASGIVPSETADVLSAGEGKTWGFFCTRCGTRNYADARFCMNCGNKMSDLPEQGRPLL